MASLSSINTRHGTGSAPCAKRRTTKKGGALLTDSTFYLRYMGAGKPLFI